MVERTAVVYCLSLDPNPNIPEETCTCKDQRSSIVQTCTGRPEIRGEAAVGNNREEKEKKRSSPLPSFFLLAPPWFVHFFSGLFNGERVDSVSRRPWFFSLQLVLLLNRNRHPALQKCSAVHWPACTRFFPSFLIVVVGRRGKQIREGKTYFLLFLCLWGVLFLCSIFFCSPLLRSSFSFSFFSISVSIGWTWLRQSYHCFFAGKSEFYFGGFFPCARPIVVVVVGGLRRQRKEIIQETRRRKEQHKQTRAQGKKPLKKKMGQRGGRETKPPPNNNKENLGRR